MWGLIALSLLHEDRDDMRPSPFFSFFPIFSFKKVHDRKRQTSYTDTIFAMGNLTTFLCPSTTVYIDRLGAPEYIRYIFGQRSTIPLVGGSKGRH